MCMCVCVDMDMLVSCMNDHTFLPTTTWLHLEINAASYNEVCHCERHYSVVFRFPGCFWENAISCYLTLHHQTHISISWERLVTKPTFHVSHWSPSQGNLCFFIPVKYLSLLQSWYLVMWSGGHSREEQCSRDAPYKQINPKPPYSEVELWHFTQWPIPLAGGLANYLTLIQSLCVCHPDIHRLAAKVAADMCC